MRLALALGKSLGEVLALSDSELALWQAWERVYGPLGPQRDDWRAAAHEAQAARRGYAIAGLKQRELQQITAERHLVFVPWDGLDDEERQREARAEVLERSRKQARRTAIAMVIRELIKRGRSDQVNAWTSKDGSWTGPLTVAALGGLDAAIGQAAASREV
jgi:hypothetical protein